MLIGLLTFGFLWEVMTTCTDEETHNTAGCHNVMYTFWAGLFY